MRRLIPAALVAANSLPRIALAFAGFEGGVETALYPDHANGSVTAKPAIEARALAGEVIRLDGRLDDPAWRDAEVGSGFRVSDPDRGAAPTDQTVFRVVYDRDAIYFGVACLEKDPSRISAKLSRRDRISGSDMVSVYIDPYLDQTTGYNFRVNPLGVQMDLYVYNDGDLDENWDAVWEAKAFRDEHGWYVEMRIPFSAIRYRAAPSMTWGLQVYRYMHGRGEDTAWVIWDRASHGFVSRFGELHGLEGIPPPRQIEIIPYGLHRSTDPAIAGPGDGIRNIENFGADLKYGVTVDLTLNATVNPDFGQVEADPATLNLSPFETFFTEKRPFFVEGSRFFEHLGYNLFYSRRVGTGQENARIRYAAKLTGKTRGGVSVGALAACTDVTGEGQGHNLFKDGTQLSRFFVGRFGQEFAGGRHHVNAMQTAALHTASRDQYGDVASREAYTTGADFSLSSRDRAYMVRGSFVGSVIDPEKSKLDSTVTGAVCYGTGGGFDIRRDGGKLRGYVSWSWEAPHLDLNDLGYLVSADQMAAETHVERQFNPEGRSRLYNRGEVELTFSRGWLWGGRTGYDPRSGAVAWRYGPRHPQFANGRLQGWMQLRNYWELWGGTALNAWGSQRYETRGGPLISEPATYGGWVGFGSDSRKNLTVTFEGNLFLDEARNRADDFASTVHWNQTSALNHELSLRFSDRHDDTQYLETVDLSARPGGIGIGGRSYVFGKIHQQTLDITLRSNILFSRDRSLELYAQPFITVGDYAEARELIRPDSYDLAHYNEPGYDSHRFDFSYATFNWNAVYRWQYRPGSTLYLVWTQSRCRVAQADSQDGNPGGFHSGVLSASPFRTEPENILLVKVTYWFAI